MKIEYISKTPILYMRRVGAYGAENHLLMETFKQELKKQQLFHRPTILGIAQDNPLTKMPEHCQYDVCLVLNDTTTSAKFPLKYGEFPEGKFAVFQLKHTAEAITKLVQSVKYSYSTISAQTTLFSYCRALSR